MSISNYTELTAAIADWLNRADLSGRIPDFVRLAEATLNKVVRSRYMVATGTVAFTSGDNRAALPAGLVDIVYVASAANVAETLTRQPADYIARALRLRQKTAGTPLYYATVGGAMVVAPVPSANKSYDVDFYQEIPPLASNSTNWLLTHYPDLYLNAALYFAAPYLADEQKAALFETAAMQQVQALIASNQQTTLEGAAFDDFKG